MRIADNTRLDSILRNITSNQQRLVDASRQASSGQRLTAPSDDPVAAAQLVRIQARIDDTQGYRSVLRTVTGDLELAESSLDGAHQVLDRLHEIALQGADGALTASERSSMADEVVQLKQQLFQTANQKGSLGYLFAGTNDQSAPFASDGSFLGNAQDKVAVVGAGQSMVVSASGAKAFTTAGGSDMFAQVDALAKALATNDQTAVSASVNSLDGCMRQVLAARTDVGLKLERAQTADAAHEQASVALSTQRSAVGDVNPAEAYTRLSSLQQGLQQSIEVAKQLLSSLSAQRF